MKLIQTEDTLAVAAAKAGMDEKTARKYRKSGKLPSQQRVEHTWRTRPDPLADVWHEVEEKLDDNAGFEATQGPANGSSNRCARSRSARASRASRARRRRIRRQAGDASRRSAALADPGRRPHQQRRKLPEDGRPGSEPG